MPPKGKKGKGKKNDDDDFWGKAGETIPNTLAISAVEGSDQESPAPTKPAFSGFAALGGMDTGDAEEEEDFGGLMSTIKAVKNKKDKKPKKGAAAVTFQEGPPPAEGSDGEETAAKEDISAAKAPVQVTAEELADEEWGPVKEKTKKGKKGKKGKAQKAEDEEEELEPGETHIEEPEAKSNKAAPAPAVKEEQDDAAGDGEGDGEGLTILSKKEKERLKKEREKAKKKAQAAAKKAAAGGGDETTAPAEPAPPMPSAAEAHAEKEDRDDDADDAAGGGKSDKKKKKKKAAKKEEAPAPVAKKPAGALAALRAAVEQKRLAEEEARRKEEEERRRIEEEEEREREEERLREEAKQKKKEKEKAKREQLKKEGKLLTKKQKEEKAAAEIRRQALLHSGVKVEGLQQQQPNGQPSAASTGPRKVVYGNRKKKGPASVEAAQPVPITSPIVTATEIAEEKEADSPKDDWEASEEEEEEEGKADKKPANVKESWDASSEDETEPPKPSAPATAGVKASLVSAVGKAQLNVAPNQKASVAPKSVSTAQPATEATLAVKSATVPKTSALPQKKAPAAAESSSEDESDSSEEEESSDEESESESDSDGMTATQRQAAQRKAEAAERRAKRHEEALAQRNKDDLRSPICCILGHVDTGKTKLLDKIRQTNVQEGEAGGITQQIGATYFPVDAIKTKTAVLNTDGKFDYKVPGLLIIDTPGHESFTNLRSRGSSLCNIAILVVDIMHGLEPQTLESLRLLRDRKTPFIVALNKIDRMYGWEPIPDNAFQDSLAKQKPSVQREFEHRAEQTKVAFAEHGLNAELYYNNKSFARNVSLVPTSAITGEGIPDMIMLLINLTQQRMSDRLMYLSELECTVLEVKVIEGLGTTIDVVLSNGILREGDRIVVCGLNGPIVTNVRALLTPQPLRELRIKSAYVHHKEVKAALGVKITAPDLEKAIAGSRLMVVGPDDDEDDLKDEIMSDLTSLLNTIDKSGHGVCVQASTLGSLEALLDFLKSSKIPVSGINIGPVHKKDVMRSATMLEKAKELACILCFDVTVDKEAEKLAEELGIRLFKADIIYHLFDAFTAYNAEIMEAKRKDAAPQAIWPCRLKVIAAFCKRDPIILGVDILDGTLRVGTPLCVVKTDPTTSKREVVRLGKITSLEINHKSMDIVKKSQAGGGVAVKIEHAVYESAKMFGRHFDEKDELLSQITRQSIDVLKESFKADVSKEEWNLIRGLKTRLGIP
ncbi:hypothetical protein BU17DRAFT_77853 [Hysterangium stoloniferum]|nr:hypothetical protein BU17DRAFT_77853 [Hysterangium stoloniferum]